MRRDAIPSLFAIALALLPCAAAAWNMPYTQPQQKYPVSALQADLSTDWFFWKKRFLSDGLVKASDSAQPAIYTSDDQAFGLLLSLWMNDTAAFNAIYAKTQSLFWVQSNGHYGFQLNAAGTALEISNFSGGAELDIAGALIHASALVDAGIWRDGTPSFKTQAKALLSNMSPSVIDSRYLVCPWPGETARNPGQHAVHWFPIFKDFSDSQKISGVNWGLAHTAAYQLFKAQTNASNGMARNWSNESGGPSGCAGCIGNPDRDNMGFDGVRVPWRIGLDAIWHRDSLAFRWIKSVWNSGKVDPAKPGMYNVADASLRGWCEDISTGCSPEYDGIHPRALWGTAAVAAMDSSAIAKAAAEAISIDVKADFVFDNDGMMGGLRNHYATQTMTLLGILAMTGNAPDVWNDLKHPWIPPGSATRITQALVASPDTITVGGKTHITVAASEPVVWKLFYKRHPATSWTTIMSTSARQVLDTTIAIKGLLAGYTANDSLDLGASWNGASDTSFVLLHVTSSTSVLPRTATLLPGIARFDGSRLLLGSSLSSESVESVRFLDATGATVSASAARSVPGGLELPQPPTRRGLLFFEIRTRNELVQGRALHL